MKVPCSSQSCGSRRIHHERPYEPRAQIMLEVPDGHTGPAYCSIECSVYGKAERADRNEPEPDAS